MSDAMSYEAFRRRRHIPVLDGMRALAILGVLTHHARGHVFSKLHGYRGVYVFFVLSGFLITTLSLREESAEGRLDVRAFMLRRIFRIMPLYYLTLVAVILWAGVFRVVEGGDALISHLPSYLFYCSEFPIISSGFKLPFAQSWSLGIEEKFYLVWPVLAFWLFARSKHRPQLALVLILLAGALAVSTGALAQIWTSYVAILLGCLLGLLLHDPESFRKLSVLGRTRTAWILLGVLALATVSPRFGGQAGECLYALTAAVTMAALVANEAGPATLLSRPWLLRIGVWSYAIYLTHQIVIDAMSLLVPLRWGRVGDALTLVLALAIDLPICWWLHRNVEKPCIALGRRFGRRSVPAVDVVHGPVR